MLTKAIKPRLSLLRTGIILLLTIAGQASPLFSQFTFALETEPGVGWWIAHNGQPGQEDKSLLVLQMGLGLRAGYTLGDTWEVGITGATETFQGSYLRAASDRVGSRDRIRLSFNESFAIRRLGLYANAWPIRSRRFRMGGGLAAGVFTETSVHFQKPFFTRQRWWRGRIPMAWKLGKFAWLEAGVNYLLQSIQLEGAAHPRQKHTINKVGGFFSLVVDF